ncbi:MAG: carboxymuconolactone decarboxylase family protein [Alphaproteobacteria bacterium]|nr:carboxymuconolactone decarboxylase family protein [Alphaproteobacteria bacterium]
MDERIDYARVSPEGYRAMLALSAAAKSEALGHALLELVKIRASQINGCAYCLDMHAREARAAGEAERRLHHLPAWRESPLFSPRERAALAWTEALTLVAETHAPDEVYAEARRHFDERELVDLSLAIVNINGWNRLAVAFRKQPPAAG